MTPGDANDCQIHRSLLIPFYRFLYCSHVTLLPTPLQSWQTRLLYHQIIFLSIENSSGNLFSVGNSHFWHSHFLLYLLYLHATMVWLRPGKTVVKVSNQCLGYLWLETTRNLCSGLGRVTVLVKKSSIINYRSLTDTNSDLLRERQTYCTVYPSTTLTATPLLSQSPHRKLCHALAIGIGHSL